MIIRVRVGPRYQILARRAQELQGLNELILSSAGEGIYGLDCSGLTTFVNPAAAEMLGWPAGDLIGKPMHTLLHHTRPDARGKAEPPSKRLPPGRDPDATRFRDRWRGSWGGPRRG